MAKGEALERILAQVRAAAPELPEATLDQIARGLCRDLGGERMYMPKVPREGKRWSLGDVEAAGVPFAQAYGIAGMSRATAYRTRRRRRWALIPE